MTHRYPIDPSLRHIALPMPFFPELAPAANVFLKTAFDLTPRLPGVLHRVISGPPFDIHVFEPEAGTDRSLLYFHGGAFFYKAAPYHRQLAQLYAREARCRVYMPDYRSGAYPLPFLDAMTAWKRVLADGSLPAGFAGDSAGFTTLAIMLANVVKPAFLMLVYPVTDPFMQSDSMKQFTDTPLWNARNNRILWNAFLKGQNPSEFDPLHHPVPVCTYVEIAEFDCLRDEGRDYARKVAALGAPVTINATRGTFHGYDMAVHSPAAQKNLRKRVSFLNRAFEEESSK
ncbi:alpha/beta hydrolase fold domain-containing protein [uncultured Faecalibaculum sp.]|uniref:alpha/beta hydrolase fold domain-containing protein n=1 Tax=uncultured Faecalibaculum sp. TaxID=1729681 RepID=UPI00260595E7|nr:alpha/beta hydrolase fold domain-containing protein [uncultured Faecalibaculum sp.]